MDDSIPEDTDAYIEFPKFVEVATAMHFQKWWYDGVLKIWNEIGPLVVKAKRLTKIQIYIDKSNFENELYIGTLDGFNEKGFGLNFKQNGFLLDGNHKNFELCGKARLISYTGYHLSGDFINNGFTGFLTGKQEEDKPLTEGYWKDHEKSGEFHEIQKDEKRNYSHFEEYDEKKRY